MYDSCDHRELALNQLIKMFPVVERGFDPCEEAATLDPNSIALIDLFGISKDPKLVSLSRQYNLPIKLLEQDLFVPTEIVAKTLSQVMQDLKWTQVAIIHSPDEYSLQIIKLLGQASLKNSFCLTMINSLPKFDEDAYTASGSDSGGYISVLRSVINNVPMNVPIFVLGSDKSVQRLFQIMADRIDVISKHQWLFSSLPDPTVLTPFINSSASFFTLSLYPASIDDFEQFWHYQHTLKDNRSSPWFKEYSDTYPSNFVTNNKISREGSLDVLWRTSQVTPIIQTLFILSLALREAWTDRCNETPGLCHDLLKLTRKEFESDFLGVVSPDSDTVKEAIISRAFGAKSSSLGDGVNLALTKLLFNGNHVQYKHIIAYDSNAEKGQILDSSIVYLSSPCPDKGCDRCLKLRQSRIVDHQNPDVQPSYSSWSFEKRSESNSQPKREADCIAKCSMQATSVQAEKLATLPWSLENNELVTGRVSSGWYIALAVLSAIGILFIIVNGFYLLMAFPMQIADAPLDYLIMSGLVALYSVNFVFLQTPTIAICITRRIGLSMSYSLILSAMLVKAMNIWRMKTLSDNGLEKLRTSTGSRLTMVTCFLLSLQAIVTIIWLIIIPPKPNIKLQTCSWPGSGDTLIATESIVSLVYVLILISMNIFFSLMVWRSRQHDHEPRWIVASCVSISIIWAIWILCSAYSNPLRAQTSLTIVCANLLSATIITVCLYMRKFDRVLRCPSKLQQQRPHFPGDLNSDRMSSQRGLNNSSFSESQYGSLPSSQKLSIAQLNAKPVESSSIITSTGTANNNKANILSSSISLSHPSAQPIISPISQSQAFKSEHAEDGRSSCGSTASSIQVQAEDLYPMEVYEGAGTLQQRYRNYYSNN